MSTVGVSGVETGRREVIVVDFNMPFWSLVGFLVKLAIAGIPAAIILAIIYFVIVVVLVGGIMGFHHSYL